MTNPISPTSLPERARIISIEPLVTEETIVLKMQNIRERKIIQTVEQYLGAKVDPDELNISRMSWGVYKLEHPALSSHALVQYLDFPDKKRESMVRVMQYAGDEKLGYPMKVLTDDHRLVGYKNYSQKELVLPQKDPGTEIGWNELQPSNDKIQELIQKLPAERKAAIKQFAELFKRSKNAKQPDWADEPIQWMDSAIKNDPRYQTATMERWYRQAHQLQYKLAKYGDVYKLPQCVLSLCERMEKLLDWVVKANEPLQLVSLGSTRQSFSVDSEGQLFFCSWHLAGKEHIELYLARFALMHNLDQVDVAYLLENFQGNYTQESIRNFRYSLGIMSMAHAFWPLYEVVKRYQAELDIDEVSEEEREGLWEAKSEEIDRLFEELLKKDELPSYNFYQDPRNPRPWDEYSTREWIEESVRLLKIFDLATRDFEDE